MSKETDRATNMLAAVISVILCAAGVGLLLAFPIKWCWNTTMPYLFSLPVITWGKAWCLSFLSSCLIKSTLTQNQKGRIMVDMSKRLSGSSTYLKTDDLGGVEHVLTIQAIELDVVMKNAQTGAADQNDVIRFVGKQKGMILKPTNKKLLVDIFGKESDAWIGKNVILHPTTCSYGSNPYTPCMRFKACVPAPMPLTQPVEPLPQSAPQDTGGMPVAPIGDNTLDEIPF